MSIVIVTLDWTDTGLAPSLHSHFTIEQQNTVERCRRESEERCLHLHFRASDSDSGPSGESYKAILRDTDHGDTTEAA